MAAKATRSSFGEAVAQIAEKNLQVVVMDADLGKSTMTGVFQKKFSDRYFEIGIAEHNLIGTAAGLAMGGKIPFATSFACFLAGRGEAIRMSVTYPNANVKLVGTHAGIGIGEDGYSQMGLEDIAALRSLPNMTIVQPADDIETKQAIAWACEYHGPVYFRLTRQKLEEIHNASYQFKFGAGDVIKNAKENQNVLTVFATGGVVYNSLKAAEECEQNGLNINVINIHTIKPLDKELILDFAKKSKRIITVEDHNIAGGLGTSVSEVVSDAGLGVQVYRHGIEGFGESGDPAQLYEKYGLSTSRIKNIFLKIHK